MVRQHHQRNLRLTAAGAGLALTALAAGGAALVPFSVGESGIEAPLIDTPGDVRRGMAVAVNSDEGNCIICHAMPIPGVPEGAFGDLGPPLAGVGDRLTEAQLRLRIVDPKIENPDTMMPAYYRVDGLRQVDKAHAGKPILTAQQVEDVVAFLKTLKEGQ